MTKFFARFSHDQSGANAVEYGLILGLIGLAVLAGAGVLGGAISTRLSNMGASVTSAGT